MPYEAGSLRIRRLRPEDHASAVRLADGVFGDNRFYGDALGLGREGFSTYWDEFLRLALSDRAARVWGSGRGADLVGLIAIAWPGFPAPARGLRFLARMGRRLGPRRTVRFLRFADCYERAMKAGVDPRVEARGLWLMVKGRARCAGLGIRLVKYATDELVDLGRPVLTGLMDADDRRLVHFYERLGFSSTPVPFHPGRASRIEHRGRYARRRV